MLIIFKSTVSYIKRNMAQCAVISFIFILSAILLFSGLSITLSESGFERIFERANATNAWIAIENNEETAKKIEDYLDNHEDVAGHKTDDAMVYINADFEKEDENLIVPIILSEYDAGREYDLLYVSEDETAKPIKDDEILINVSLAQMKDISVGDRVIISIGDDEYEFTVSQLVVDVQFNNSFNTPDRCFVSEGFFDKNNITATSKMIGIKYVDAEGIDEAQFMDTLNKNINIPYTPLTIKYKDIKISYAIVQGIVANILVVLAVLMLSSIVLIIGNIINNTIIKQYGIIGVKRAIGYSNRQIRRGLSSVFILLAAVSSFVGACIGSILSDWVNDKINSALLVNTNIRNGVLIPITIGVITLVVLIFTTISLIRINNVKPIQAIKFGMPEHNFAETRFAISDKRRTSLPLLLAVKSICQNKVKTAVQVFIVLVMVFISLTLYNVQDTISDQKYFINSLFSNQIGDVVVESNENNKAIDVHSKLAEIDYVDNVIPVKFKLSDSIYSHDGRKISVGGTVLYGVNAGDILMPTKGRAPQNDYEICITDLVADTTNKSIGDYIDIYSIDSVEQYLICGIASSANMSGYTYTAVHSEIDDSLVESETVFWVYYDTDKISKDRATADIEALFDYDIVASNLGSSGQSIVDSLEGFMMIIDVLIVIFFFIIAFVIFIFTSMDINNYKKTYGIMKAIGFDNTGIIWVNIVRTLIIASVGTALGCILNYAFADRLFNIILNSTGSLSMNLPLIFSGIGTGIIVLGYGVVSVVSALIPCRHINRISPRQIIVE